MAIRVRPKPAMRDEKPVLKTLKIKADKVRRLFGIEQIAPAEDSCTREQHHAAHEKNGLRVIPFEQQRHHQGDDYKTNNDGKHKCSPRTS